MSVNKVVLLGRLTKDIELKYTANSNPVANFTIATSDKYKDSQDQWQEKTEFSNCVVWGKLAEACNRHLKKGKQVYVEGKLQTRSWDAKDGSKRYTTEVIVKAADFIDGYEKKNQAQQSNQLNSMLDTAKDAFKIQPDATFTTDDIPF